MQLSDPRDLSICNKWINRFNLCEENEREKRNMMAEHLVKQLLQDNLNYPFIFQNNLSKPLNDIQCNEPDGEIKLAFDNLKGMLKSADQMNENASQDIMTIKTRQLNSKVANLEKTIAELREKLSYAECLLDCYDHYVLEFVPSLIVDENRELSTFFEDYQLNSLDVGVFEEATRLVRTQIGLKLEHFRLEETENKDTQTDLQGNSDMEQYYEKKFLHLYNYNMMKAKEIEVKAFRGELMIQMSKNFTDDLCKKSQTAMRVCNGEGDE
jgi:polyhydroxyalkanoate synthesis regulator phasin